MTGHCAPTIVQQRPPRLISVRTEIRAIAPPSPRAIAAPAPAPQILTPAAPAVILIPQGPRGPAGAAGSGLTVTQATPATVWTIAHNLGIKPAVATFRLGGTEIKGAIHHLTVNALTVTFNIAVAGFARLS